MPRNTDKQKQIITEQQLKSARRLREEREKLKEEALCKGQKKLYTHEYMAKKLNVNPSLISLHESGRRRPTLEQFDLYSRIYNCDTYYLTGIKDVRKPYPDDGEDKL